MHTRCSPTIREHSLRETPHSRSPKQNQEFRPSCQTVTACSHSCSSTHRDAGLLGQASTEYWSLFFIKENHMDINMKNTYTKLVPPQPILYTPSFQNDFPFMQVPSYHFPVQNLCCSSTTELKKISAFRALDHQHLYCFCSLLSRCSFHPTLLQLMLLAYWPTCHWLSKTHSLLPCSLYFSVLPQAQNALPQDFPPH